MVKKNRKQPRTFAAGHRARMRTVRAIVNTFAENDYEMADMVAIYDAVRQRVNLLECMGLTRDEIVRAAEQQFVHDVMRQLRERIDGSEQRTFQYDGAKWVHLPGKLYTHTRAPETPDAKVRRDELVMLIDAILAYRKPLRDGLTAVAKGLKQIKAHVKAGQQFELPFIDEEQRGA